MAVKRYFRGKQRGKRENGRKRKVFLCILCKKSCIKCLLYVNKVLNLQPICE